MLSLGENEGNARDNELQRAVSVPEYQEVRSHQAEKLEALRNAVLNSALPNAPDDDLQLMFLNYVDSMTSWHRRLLRFFESPLDWGSQNNVEYPSWPVGGPPSAVMEVVFPELRERRQFYELLVVELFAKGLIDTDDLHVEVVSPEMFASRVTPLGGQFIKFITSPLDGER